MSMRLCAQIQRDYDLAQFSTDLRAAVKARGLQPGPDGELRKTLDKVPPAHTLGWILLALCDSAEDDGSGCVASEEYILWKTGVSRTTLYTVFVLLDGAGIIERKTLADGRVEKTIHLENLPAKAPWERPQRGRPKRDNGSALRTNGSALRTNGSALRTNGSALRTKPLPERLPEILPISEPVASEQSEYPIYDPDLPYSDPIVPGRILDASPLWIKVLAERLKPAFSPAQYDSWVLPLRLYRHEETGEYILTGRSSAQVDMASRWKGVLRYGIAMCCQRATVELRIMRHADLEAQASRSQDTALVYPPMEVGT